MFHQCFMLMGQANLFYLCLKGNYNAVSAWLYLPFVLFVYFSVFLPARRYASAGNSDRNVSVRPSVRLSVRPSRAGIVSKRRKLAA